MITFVSTLWIATALSCGAQTDPTLNASDSGFVSNEYFTFGVAANRTAGIALSDLDGDGDLDAIAVNGRHWTQQDYIFLNNGSGRFTTARPLDGELTTGYDPRVTDFDDDGDPDILVPRDRIANRYYENLGSGLFAAPVIFGRSGPARGLVIADFDRDGHKDVVVSQRSGTNYVVSGGGRGFGGPVEIDTGSETVRGTTGDFNADGAPDLAFADIGQGGGLVQINDGRGQFTAPARDYPGHGADGGHYRR